jgi:hypothetical protein
LSPPVEDVEEEPGGAVSAALAPLVSAAASDVDVSSVSTLAAADGVTDGGTVAPAEVVTADAAMSQTVCADIELALAAASVSEARRPAGLAVAPVVAMAELVRLSSASTSASSASSPPPDGIVVAAAPGGVVAAAVESAPPSDEAAAAAAAELFAVVPVGSVA